jgi:serine protease
LTRPEVGSAMPSGVANAQRLIASIEAASGVREPTSDLRPARFSVGLRPDQTLQDMTPIIVATLAVFDPLVNPLSELDDRTLVITLRNRLFLQESEKMFEAAYAMADSFALEFAEPEVLTHVMPIPDPARRGPATESIDDFPPGCWAPQEPDLDKKRLWALSTLQLQDAWDFSKRSGRPTRGKGTIVAQPDTGIARHPNLDPHRRVQGHNFVEGGDDPTDPLNYLGNPGHGTGTGSVVVGSENSDMAGAAPLATHMPIRAVESVVRLSQITVAEAIDFAVVHKAHVISLSLGGIPSISLYRALQRAIAADVIVVTAAGNCVEAVVWPARYDLCVAVAGTNVSDQPWQGTCHGSDVAISAPGENVYRAHVELKSGQIAADVGQGQGTSFATALIAGIAACWLAHHGRDTVMKAARGHNEKLQNTFRRMLKATARRPKNWDTSEMGAGVANAWSLLTADFGVGLGLETAGATGEPPEAATKRFVSETAGIEAASALIDWKRFGPEIALTLLSRKAGRPPSLRGIGMESAALARQTPLPLSPSLSAELASHPALANAIGPLVGIPT